MATRPKLPSRLGKAYDPLLAGICKLLEDSRRAAAKSINSIMTISYWEIGRRIVEEEQKGQSKADYGEQIINRLADDLTRRFGRGFSRTNVFQMRQFYLAYRTKVQTVSGLLPKPQKIQTVSGLLPNFPLSWSHYARLLTVADEAAKRFYEAEAVRGGWSIRQLDRQIATQFYERSKKSKRKISAKAEPGDSLTPDEEVRDPCMLEFLALKGEYSESDLEEALIHHLERFLLEMGCDFTFIARQKRLRIGNQWYRVDLLLFHRRLRCLVLIDLKLGRFSHADAGQMNLYLNYAREHWTYADENQPIGLILCSERDDAVAHYALGNINNRVLAREYKLSLPKEKTLVQQISSTRRALRAKTSEKEKKISAR